MNHLKSCKRTCLPCLPSFRSPFARWRHAYRVVGLTTSMGQSLTLHRVGASWCASGLQCLGNAKVKVANHLKTAQDAKNNQFMMITFIANALKPLYGFAT